MAGRREELDDELVAAPEASAQLILTIGESWLTRFNILVKEGKASGYDIRASAVKSLQRFIERTAERLDAGRHNGKGHSDDLNRLNGKGANE